MSRRSERTPEQLGDLVYWRRCVMIVACPKCNATAHSKCTGSKDQRRSSPHKERVQAWRDAGKPDFMQTALRGLTAPPVPGVFALPPAVD